jgi:hypothetical protein
MIEVPKNLQSLWNELSKDGAISPADFQKLQKNLDTNNLNEQEKTFLKSLAPALTETILVKNGSSQHTFDFVDNNKSDEKTMNADNKIIPSEYAKSTLPKSIEILRDFIGIGAFKKSVPPILPKVLLKVIAKQGLLDETLNQLSNDERIRAFNIITNGPKVDSGDLMIAKAIKNSNPLISKETGINIINIINLSPNKNVDNVEINFKNIKISEDEVDFVLSQAKSNHNKWNTKEFLLRGIADGKIPLENFQKINTFQNGFPGFSIEDRKVLFNTLKNSNQDIPTKLKNLTDIDLDYGNEKEFLKFISNEPKLPEDFELPLSAIDKLTKMGITPTYFKLINEEGVLTDKELAALGKHVNGDTMANDPKAAAKILTAMIKTYNNNQNEPVTLKNIEKFIKQVDKDWFKDDNVMRLVLKSLGNGSNSELEKFKKLAPATLDSIRKIAD